MRSPEFEKLRHMPPVAFGDRWPVPDGRAGRGADILTRKKRWSFDLRYHSNRKRSKKFKRR